MFCSVTFLKSSEKISEILRWFFFFFLDKLEVLWKTRFWGLFGRLEPLTAPTRDFLAVDTPKFRQSVENWGPPKHNITVRRLWNHSHKPLQARLTGTQCTRALFVTRKLWQVSFVCFWRVFGEFSVKLRAVRAAMLQSATGALLPFRPSLPLDGGPSASETNRSLCQR